MLTFQDLVAACGGEWLVPPASEKGILTAIDDDSRRLAPGALFVAIAGELTDGHRYIRQAAEAGAGSIVVQAQPAPELLEILRSRRCACLKVADSLRAYQQLALWHRRQYPEVKVLAITGSCGKTSTKEMCAAILQQRWPQGVLKTIGSTNNHFGVPRNLLRINEGTRVAVIEMGTNHPGEIANLVSLAPPDVGLVCNIGHAHLEFFHDLRGVATEKGDLLAGTLPQGIAVFPADAEGADILRAKAGGRTIVTFGATPDADVQYEYLGFRAGHFQLRLKWRETGATCDIAWSTGGAHMAANAAAAAAAATALGIGPDQIADGLAACVLPGQRLELKEVHGVHWVNDAFNSNPDSCRAALDWFAEVAPADAPRTLILGDMLELGEHSANSHRDILDYALQHCKGAAIVVVGAAMAAAAATLPHAHIQAFPDANALKPRLPDFAVPGAWLLLKSSHGIHLAELCP